MKKILLFIVLSMLIGQASWAQTSKMNVFYSLAIPGLGQHFMGEKESAKLFWVTEAVLIVGAISLDYYQTNLYDNNMGYARTNAGVSGKIDHRNYIIALGEYENISAYNIAMIRDRNFSAMFPENSDYHWQWNSDDKRFQFKKTRQDADVVGYATQFVVGTIVVNHLISAFHVFLKQRSASDKTSSRLPMESSFQMNAIPVDSFSQFGKGMTLNLSWNF